MPRRFSGNLIFAIIAWMLCRNHLKITLNVWLVLPASPQYALPVAPLDMHSSPTSSLLHKYGGPSSFTTAILAVCWEKLHFNLLMKITFRTLAVQWKSLLFYLSVIKLYLQATPSHNPAGSVTSAIPPCRLSPLHDSDPIVIVLHDQWQLFLACLV